MLTSSLPYPQLPPQYFLACQCPGPKLWIALGSYCLDKLILITFILMFNLAGGNDISYSPTWVVFQPNIIVDARNGQLFTVNLKVKRYFSMDLKI